MKDLNRFMSYAEFKECHDIKVNYLSFYGLLSALKALKATFKDKLRDNTTIYEDPVNRFLTGGNRVSSHTRNLWLASRALQPKVRGSG